MPGIATLFGPAKRHCFSTKNISSIELLNWSRPCSLNVYSGSAKQLKPAMNVSVFGRDTGASDHKRMQTKDFLKMQRM